LQKERVEFGERMTRFQAPTGTHDILPADFRSWNEITRTAEEVCALYGYRPIRTPGFEDTELFTRTSGAGSDVVRKEMYTFEDRGGRSLTLRPEATAPICRAYVEHGLHREPQPQKLFTVVPLYRYDRPQKGRYREHHQLSVEAIGSDDPAVDAELIQLYVELLRRLGVGGYTIKLNSIGDRNCRPAYVEQLQTWLAEHDSKLDEDTRQKAKVSPLRVFDTKNPELAAALADAPTIGDSLCDACAAHFADVRRYLDAYGVHYAVVPTLVRGLDYYTRTTFEFTGSSLGAQDALVGGGRYDYLVEEIGGPPTPAIGFGAGIERLQLSLESEPPETGLDVFFAFEEGADRSRIAALMAELRQRDRSCDTDYAARSLKGQLTQAGRLGARTTVVVDAAGATLRRSGTEDVHMSLDQVVDALA
jgi:histidyl-tRNA synthetase